MFLEGENMKYLSGSLAAALALIACGCASSPPMSNAEIAQAESEIRSAENATATQHARDLLDRARGDLVAAQHEWQARNWEAARRRIAETRAAASAAESKARAVAMQQQAEEFRRHGDDMERRARELAQPAPQ
jgi:starvation-inducible outer membrane lipoprotein